MQGYIFWPFPPPLGVGDFLCKLKNREEFEGGLEKKKRVIKHTLKYLYEANKYRKKIQKNREEF